jgi:ATP-dependent Lhr-like helicase
MEQFSERTRRWFEGAFAAPTAAQEQAWPAIASGDHVLISAPTGSGKTLAAFLWAIDRLAGERAAAPGSGAAAPGSGGAAAQPVGAGSGLADTDVRRVGLVYVSPLKALSYDIDRNLRAPLRGIGAPLSVAVRTGDTPQRERAAMLKKPPDILITTPESLYLMLTSRARELFAGARWCIVDEVHAVAATKRGSHLAITLERLEQAAGQVVQRIGLSATQNPLEEVSRFLVGPQRRCRIVDTGVRKRLDLQIQVPVDSMLEPQDTPAPALDPLQGGSEATRRSIWPAIYPELLSLIGSHRSTIVFVNNRRGAERLALRLNELAGREIARAHHGSLAREERTVVEELLKAGELPCLVATSSLELGIDMGAVDLVIQVESPKSVARGLQRIGRAGHSVGDVSRGRIFPKFRADLLECAVLARRMRDAKIEATVVPRNALDVLAQQVVAIAAAGGEERPVATDQLYALITRTYSYSELTRGAFEAVLDMLDGRYPSSEFSELRPRIVWDRIAGTIRPRPGVLSLAVTNAGTIPDRGLYAVTLPDGRRVGELDEEMVYEARPGQTFLLGASTWRIEEIGRDRVIVTPAPGLPGAVPFWRGDTLGRPRELGEAIGAFSRWAVDQPPEVLERDYDLDERAARNLLEFLREQQAATRVLPSDRTVVVERFRDEIGDWRLCVLSPFGGRVHAAWGLALSAAIREELGLESDAIWSDDGIIVHLPDADELDLPRLLELILIAPEEVEERVVAELSGSALFGARFRENAGRALLIPRARPGKRTPLWQQRLRAQTLLEVARRYPEFPIVLETYRECLRDVLDLPGLQEILTKLQRREISLVEVETQSASPFASSLLFDYVAAYMYEGDTPNAERRAAALSLDRDLLRELLGQDELRDLLDPRALEQVEADLQFLSPERQATSRDQLHDVLRVLGDLTPAEARARVLAGLDAQSMLEALRKERRVVEVRLGGEQRVIDAADAGLYRDALGAAPPGGLPAAFLEDLPDARERLVRRYAATHGPFSAAQLRGRYGVDLSATLQALERAGELVRGELRPGGSEREWCDLQVLRRLRRASLAVLRHEIEPVEQRALARFYPAWQNVDRHPASGAGIDRLREALVVLQALALPAEAWERSVLPRRIGAYSPAWLDQLCASGEVVWIGAGALGRHSGRVALYFREDLPLLGPPAGARAGGGEIDTSGAAHEALRARLAAGACFFTDLLVDLELSPEMLQEALWDLVWAGEATNDAFAPLRAPRLTLARAQRDRALAAGRTRSPRFSARRRRSAAAPALQGRWSLTAPLLSAGVDPGARRRALAELLLERYGVLTREQVLAEGIPGGFSALYPDLVALETLGIARRGYFVEGLGGAQFALPGAVERLRSPAGTGTGTGVGMGAGAGTGTAGGRAEPVLVLAALDPAQPYGAALRWPGRDAGGGGRGPARVPGAFVVLVGGDPVLYLERSGRGLLTLVEAGDPRLERALGALVDAVGAGRVPRLGIERVDGEPAPGSRLGPALIAAGFQEGPRRLTLSA